jgi:hypothetical protein
MAEKEKESKYEVVQVPTNHELAIQTPEGEVMTLMQGIVEILNKLDKVTKKI